MTFSHPEAEGSGRQLDRACDLLYHSHQISLVKFARQRGCDEHEAWDVVQELFLRTFRLGMLLPLCAKPPEWQRAWLLRTLNWIVLNHWRQKTALRRSGGSVPESIDVLLEQGQDLAGPESPEAKHDRAWIMSVIDRGVNKFRSNVGEDRWERLEPSLFGSDNAVDLVRGTSASRVAVHRARTRLREMVASEAASGAGIEKGRAVLFEALIVRH